jgi:histidyl-tRNA synthetase
MSSTKPSLPKGTRDFGPEQTARRAYIMDTLRRHFGRYGFQALETPAMENLSTLTGKYGDEGDQLLFKILNSGDFLSKAAPTDRESSQALLPKISEKGLRYDLTVPFARYVVTHQHEITYPFKRYQMQPVWRADRPQRGRYREFYQCDADIIGSRSVWNETELTLLIHDVFADLRLDGFVLKVNHRGILNALAKQAGMEGREMAFCVEIDKLDKIGRESVMANLQGIGASNLEAVMDFLTAQDSPENVLKKLSDRLGDNQAIAEMAEYFSTLQSLPGRSWNISFDLSLARGLTYYTGMIFEVKPTTVQMGSICGGGRYDDLTGVFGLPGVSGVGISFGLDRIYDVLEESGLFPQDASRHLDVFVIHFDEATFRHGQQVVQELRSQGIKADIFPEVTKVKKQFAYADKTGVTKCLVIGEEEMNSGVYQLKDLVSGEQTGVKRAALLAELTKG